MGKLLTIKVTRKDIRDGNRRNDLSCPIALALNRTTGNKWSVTPGLAKNLTQEKLCDLPIEAMEFIDEFDYFGSGEPFTFEIELDDNGSATADWRE